MVNFFFFFLLEGGQIRDVLFHHDFQVTLKINQLYKLFKNIIPSHDPKILNMFWIHILFYKTCGPIENAILNSIKELNIRYTFLKI